MSTGHTHLDTGRRSSGLSSRLLIGPTNGTPVFMCDIDNGTHRQNFLNRITEWYEKNAEQTYQVVFYCSRSMVPGHDPFTIILNKDWVVTMMPYLRFCLDVLRQVVNARGIPIPNFKFMDFEMIGNFYDSVKEAKEVDLSALTLGGQPGINERDKVLKFTGKGLKTLAKIVEGYSENWTTTMTLEEEDGVHVWVIKTPT